MCRPTRITLLLCWIFTFPAALCAQSPLRGISYPNNLLSASYILSPENPLQLKNIYLKPINIPGYESLHSWEPFAIAFDMLQIKSTKNSDLFYQSWYSSGFASATEADASTKRKASSAVNHDVFYALYNKPHVSEKKKIRASWKKTIGVDVWYPYYKTKDIEDWIKERFSVKVFGLKGKPQFEKNQIIYVFKSKF